MICEIVTPNKMLYSGEAVFVSAPAAEGEVGFMKMAAPLMSTLSRGEVRIKETENAEPVRIAVAGGYLESDGYKVVVLANHALDVSLVEEAVSRERIAENEKRLAEVGEDDSRAVFYKEEIAWQQHLIKLASRH